MKTYKIGDTVRVELETRFTRQLKTIYIDPSNPQVIYLQPYTMKLIETQTEADYYNAVELLLAPGIPCREGKDIDAEIPGT